MNHFKNGKCGTLELADHVDWDEAKDIQYYLGIHGNDEAGQDPRRHMVGRIERNSDRVRESFDRAIWFFGNAVIAWMQRCCRFCLLAARSDSWKNFS